MSPPRYRASVLRVGVRVGALWSCGSLDYNFRACGAGPPNKSHPRFVYTQAKSEPVWSGKDPTTQLQRCRAAFPGAPTKAESRFVLLGGIEIPVATTERDVIPGSTVSGLEMFEISEKSLDLKVKNAKFLETGNFGC